MTWLKNFIDHPNTTMAGLASGSVLGGIVYFVMQQAQCDFGAVQWSAVVLPFVVNSLIGGAAKDPSKVGG